MLLRFILLVIGFQLTMPFGFGQRDPYKWPFSKTSIWNMPIHQDAEYVDARIEPPEVGAALLSDEDYILFEPDAPMTPVYVNYTRWQHYGNRCDIKGHLLMEVPVPEDFVVSPENWLGETPNAGIAILMPDRVTIKQTQPFARCEEGGHATSRYVWEDQSLYGDGIYGAHGGSSLSAIGGAIRLGELVPGGTIRHALKIIIHGAKYLYYDDQTRGWRWPARVSDGYAPFMYGVNGNPVKDVRMGSLLALPAYLDLESLEFETGNNGPAMILARALQNYGAYIIDDPYAEAFMFATEWSPEGRVLDEFENKWGYSFETGTHTPWGRDIGKIARHLHAVANNAPETIGGGPTGDLDNRLAPPACDFGAPGSGLMCSGPNVKITHPMDESSYILPGEVEIEVDAFDDSSNITRVDFYDNFAYLGTDSVAPYSYTYRTPSVGEHWIKARATSKNSYSRLSSTVKFDILASNPPQLEIMYPKDRQVLDEDTTIPFRFAASDSDGEIVKVELYINDSLVGESYKEPFEVSWRASTLGLYSVKAIATDNSSTKAYSQPINITIGNCQTGINQIINGTFEDGATSWDTWFAFQNSIRITTEIMVSGNRFLKASIQNVPSNAMADVRLYTFMNYEADKSYRICFKAKAEDTKDIRMVVKEAGLNSVIRWQKEITLDTSVFTYGPYLFHLGTSVEPGVFSFHLGSDTNDVWIDDIIITDGDTTTTSYSDVLSNGNTPDIFPNPASKGGYIGINLPETRSYRVEIFDLHGTMIYNRHDYTSNNPIMVQDFTDTEGMYVVKFHSKESTIIKKIVVK